MGKDFTNLCAVSEGGYIHIWNLLNKNLIYTKRINKGNLNTLLKWSDRYIIVSDKKNCSFYVIHFCLLLSFVSYISLFLPKM